MTVVATEIVDAYDEMPVMPRAVGPIGRLGRYAATHFRGVLVAWLVVAAALGFLAPRVETALSGAGWEATGSQSVQARDLIDRQFHGLSSYALTTVLYSPSRTVGDPEYRGALAAVERTLRADGAVRNVVAPARGITISPDRHTAIVQAGAAESSDGMVRAADELKGRLRALSTPAVRVDLTGAAGLWSDFNAANRAAMLKSEVISWPVTLGILLIAFGSLVAAGLPLMLTMVGLMCAAGLLYLGTLIVLVVLAIPVTQLKTAMPSIKVVPSSDPSRVGYYEVQRAFGPGATGPLQIVAPAAQAKLAARVTQHDPGIAEVVPTQTSGGYALITAIPRQDPSNPAVGHTIDRLPAGLPAGALVGGAVAENHDLQAALSASAPLVIGVVLGLGFVLLLIALRAPLIAAVGVLTNLLATGAAFGVAKWIFQDGWLHSLLGFQPQGFVDAWAPVFFFAMIFAISMDYTVFLLSSAKEHWDRSHDPHEAMVGAVAHSGRVIFAAAAVMVAVFFTFALSGPLPPKEMGIILGVAVLLDAALIRLLLLPVLLRAMGRWAWYLPRWARRMLPAVTFGHA